MERPADGEDSVAAGATTRAREAPAPEPGGLDVIVLASVGALLVLGPVQPLTLWYLSAALGLESPLTRDPLGAALAPTATLLLALYFVVGRWLVGARAERLKLAIVGVLTLILVVLPAVSDMAARHALGTRAGGRQVSLAHDGGVLQTEAAMRLMLRGRNPYSADYRATEMAQGVDSRPEVWRPLGFVENPGYGFYPYPPLTFILPIPFDAVARATLGWYDQRMLHLLALLVLGLLAYLLPTDPRWRVPLVALLLLSPITSYSFAIGTNDVLAVTAVVTTLFFLTRRRYALAALALGVGCVLKQYVAILVPFHLAYLWSQLEPTPLPARLRGLARRTWPLWVTLVVVMLPFWLWDPSGFLRGIIPPQASAYPIRASSLGLTGLLVGLGWIASARDAVPVIWLLVVIAMPLGAGGVWRVARARSLRAMVAWQGLTLFACCYLLRHFAANYLGLVVALMVLALVAIERPEAPAVPPDRA